MFPLANVYHLVLGRRSIIKTSSVRLHMEDSCRNLIVVAMATTDRDARRVFETYMTSRRCFYVFYAVNFLCFRGNRVNIQGVSPGKATEKSVHKFWRNSQFSFLT